MEKKNGKGKYYSESPLLKEKERKRKMFKPTKEKKEKFLMILYLLMGNF